MRQLNRTESLIFLAGGILMVAGAGCFTFMWQQQIACWVFLAGALMFATMQIMQRYEGQNLTIRRLKRIMTVADVAFVLSGVLMTDNVYHFIASAFSGYTAYYQYVYNKWVLLLLVAAILEIYTMHRISTELRKE